MVQQKLVSSEKTNEKEKICRDEPELRFPEFNNKWKIIKIEDNATIKGRIGWKNLKSEEYTDEGPYLIAGKHINNGIINWDECDHITNERYLESPEIALKKGDIIFSKDGSLGNPALIKNLDFEATINGTMMLVRLNQNKINPNYFYQVLNSDYFFRLLHLLKSGSSIPHIFQRDMVNFKFPTCSLDEQVKIATFLEKIDKKIELLEKKLVLYQQLEAEWRKILFKDIELNSKFFTVNEIFKVISSKRFQIKNSEIKDKGKIPVLTQGKDKAGYFDNAAKLCNIFPIILFGDHTTHLQYINYPFIVAGDGIKLLQSRKENTNMKYLYYALKNYNISPEGYKRHYSILKEVELPIPSDFNQENIVLILNSLENKINLLKDFNKEFKLLKKGLLQKMFI